MSFIKRSIEIHLTLSKGNFGDGNTKVIRDLGMSASVQKLGPPDFPKASVEIYGMALDEIQALTSLSFHPFKTSRNFINIYAGDNVSGMSEVFAGSIVSAHGDFSGCPEHKLVIDAEAGFWGRVYAQGPGVVSGVQDAASYVARQAAAAGMTFSNEGVSARLRNCIFHGSPIEQARQVAAQIGADLLIDDEQMILLPKNGHRKGMIPLLSAQSGLLGYPAVTGDGIECRSIFNPAYRFAGLFRLETVVPKAKGEWRCVKLTHKLAANMAKDCPWESTLTGYYPQFSGAVGKMI